MNYRRKDTTDKSLKLCNNSCVICGWHKMDYKGNSLVEGAHIRDYSDAPEIDDYKNIIALCPNHHREFDAGNFYIDPDTRIVYFYDDDEYNYENISSRIKYVDKRYLIYKKSKIEEMRKASQRG
ncbi:HNH endonuclease [Selenomonas sp. WCT3]|uniref:HNH endonuclease signature motif containing protein n=1 Tax=Selenomonas sp. WCT3 TaxID=3158785 RepID=UPI0008838E98|nr:HNH endonuclease [Selenomonas ruminantium]